MTNIANRRLSLQSHPWVEVNLVEFIKTTVDETGPKIDEIFDEQVGGGDREQTYTYEPDPTPVPVVESYPRAGEKVEALFLKGYLLVRGRDATDNSILFIRAYPDGLVLGIDVVIAAL